MNDNAEKYAKGFNDGYVLPKHTPEIYSVIEKGIEPKTDYLEGFLSGGEEYEIEKNSPSRRRNKEKDKDHDIEHDR